MRCAAGGVSRARTRPRYSNLSFVTDLVTLDDVEVCAAAVGNHPFRSARRWSLMSWSAPVHLNACRSVPTTPAGVVTALKNEG